MGALRLALVLFLVASLAGIAVLPRLVGVTPPAAIRPVEIGLGTPERKRGPQQSKPEKRRSRSELATEPPAAPPPEIAPAPAVPPIAAQPPTEPTVPAVPPAGDDDEGDDDDDEGDD